MNVDVDAAGLRFGWFLSVFDKKTERLVRSSLVRMDTAEVSQLVGEQTACAEHPVRPEWRAEIEAGLDAPVDWEAYDYVLGCGRLHDLGDETNPVDVRRYPFFAPP
jgi:hypothetical protein